MRPEFDRQFDSLLREHARRAASAGREGGARAPVRDGRSTERDVTAAAAHLDADELSAFAENALPASARARHTAHLAECGDCRRLVSQIALASGVADEIERREPSLAAGPTSAAAASPAWRERLASLLRPGAWRYAVPLAALLVVSAAVLVLMNGRRRAELGSVALQRENARRAQGQSAETHHAAEQKQPANSNAAEGLTAAAKAAPENADADKTGARTSDSVTRGAQDTPAAPAPVGSVAGGSQSAPAEVAKSAATEAAPPPSAYAVGPLPVPPPTPAPPAPAQQQPRDLAAAAPQPTPAPAKLEDNKAAESKEKDRYEERNAAEARKQRGHGPMRNESQQQANVRNRQADESRADAAPKSDGNSARAGGAALATGRAARREAEKREGEKKSGDDREDGAARGGETRSVGGRRFRRQGAAWVDTAYRPSQATVRVSRGSEQYRALVGDEPELGRIANALGGEVVIVWEGRAYRIKP